MDPLATLSNPQHATPISALSFIQDPVSNENLSVDKNVNGNNYLHESFSTRNGKSLDENCFQFRCSQIIQSSSFKQSHTNRLKKNKGDQNIVSSLSKLEATEASLSLQGSVLATSDTKGCAHLWNLSTRRIVADFGTPSNGQPHLNANITKKENDPYAQHAPGLAIRRMHGSNHFLYHTRSSEGLVTIYDIERCVKASATNARDCISHGIVESFHTGSRTFCAASPCVGDPNLLVLPSENEAVCTIRDIRMDPTRQSNMPFSSIHGAYGSNFHDKNGFKNGRKYGMITSLSMISNSNTATPILACGMESGDLFFHNLAGNVSTVSSAADVSKAVNNTSSNKSAIKLGKDPILCLDLTSSALKSSSKHSNSFSSILSISGCAGDAQELSSLPKSDQATISVVKTITPSNTLLHSNHSSTNFKQSMESRIRNRLGTCQIGECAPGGGKPGVSTCRYRKDGKIFAVGGWDKRVRIFTRDGSKLLAILKGHFKSVTVLDWSDHADQNGLLATGSDDGNVKIWRVLPSNSDSKKNLIGS